MFTPDQRDAVRDRVVELASADPRVVAGAVVGSLALGADRWSDLDLTFATADGVPALEVLDDLGSAIISEFSAVRLFDLRSGATTYRVFILPGFLQVDLSVAPASEFRLIGPKVRVLFGQPTRVSDAPQPPSETDFGYAVHHVVRARLCIERGRHWQAEYWISGARDLALGIACRRHGVEASHGRGFDQLPPHLLELAAGSLVRSMARDELVRALGAVIELMHTQAECAPHIMDRVQLRELAL